MEQKRKVWPNRLFMIAFLVLPNSLVPLTVAGGFTAAMSTVQGMVFGHASDLSLFFHPSLDRGPA